MFENRLATDQDLVKLASTGNKDAFSLIVQRYQTLICTIAYNATGNIVLSEDIAQDVFLIAWEKLQELREPEKLRAWLCGISRNIVKDRIRHEQYDITSQSLSLCPDYETPSTSVLPYDQAISEEEQKILWQSIEKIPDKYREPMILFYREQQSIEKVAESLDLSQDAIKQRLSRGRKMLKKQVAMFVEGALGRSGPTKAFTIAVLAALPPIKIDALASTGTTVASSTGVLSAKATFWLSLGNVLLGLLVFILTRGYLILFGFVGFSAYLLLRHPAWYGSEKAKIWKLIIPCSVLALIFGLRESLYWSLLFVLFVIVGLFAFHPGCPNNVKTWFFGSGELDPLYPWKKWRWQVPPKNWMARLGFFLSTGAIFTIIGMYFIYKTTPKIAWGLVAMSFLMALNFSILAIRLIVKVLSCYYFLQKKT